MDFGKKMDSRALQKVLGAVLASGCVMANSGGAEGAPIMPDSPSNNTVVINENSIEINGTTNVFDSSSASAVEVDGGYGTNGEESVNNHVILNNGSVGEYGYIRGGVSMDSNASNINGNASNNVIEIYGGVAGNVTGGFTTGNASNNSITIYGGTISGDITGGAGTETNNNSINIYNSPNLNATRLTGGLSSNSINNSLNMHTKDITVRVVSGFQNLNFYLDSNIQNGDTMLTVTNIASLYGTQVSAIVEGDTTLTDGDTVTLLNASTLSTDDATTYRGVLAEGISFEHQLTVEKVDDHRIVATIGPGTTPTIEPGGNTNSNIAVSDNSNVNKLFPQTEAVGQTPTVEMQVMSAGFNRLLDWLPPEDFGSADIEMDPGTNESPTVEEEPGTEDTDETSEDSEDSEGKNTRFKGSNGFEIFANMGGSSMRTKTGHGSYVDTKSGGMDIGAARTLGNSKGKLTFAPIFDYGSGSYDTHLGSGVRGSGNARYWAGGMIARQTQDNGFYYEGSFRMGRTDADFASNDFRQGGHPVRLTYDVSSNCYAGHIRVGKVFRLNKQSTAHFYGIYSHNHINGSSTKLSTGETYRFSAADSGLFRLGCRFTRQINDHSRLYSGLAYQYEFNGESDATYKGYTTPGSSTKGSSAMVELGYQLKPTKSSPVMLDLGLVGWMGMQKGVGLQLKFKREF